MQKQEFVYHISPSSVAKAILVGGLFFVLFLLKDLLLVVLAAVVTASAVEPITRWFIRYRIARLPAVIFIYVGLAFLLVGVFYFLVLPLLSDTASLLNTLPDYLGSVSGWTPFAGGGVDATTVSVRSSIVSDISNSFPLQDIANDFNKAILSLSQGFWETASFAFGGFLSFFLIVVLSFYLAVQDHGIRNFLSVITPGRQRGYVLDLWRRAEEKIGLWMQGQLLLVIIVAVLVYLGLTLLGVNHALPLAVIAGLFEIIPVFGPILASIPAVAIGFADGGVSAALFIGGLYLIIQQFENQLIYPLVVKKVVGVPPVVVILALIAGGQLAGFLGILLAVPLAAVLMEMLNDYQKENVAEKLVAPQPRM
ncbi:MAG: hypothetical protein RJA61_390 [Candidatus Parcubacteria bacterium]|jgi:predicted PurR-regulated permease PerM